jgi:hypothetical protein
MTKNIVSSVLNYMDKLTKVASQWKRTSSEVLFIIYTWLKNW